VPVETAVEPLTSTAVERVRAGGGSGPRARLLIAAWLVGFAGVAGVAVAGKLVEPAVSPVVGAEVTPAPASRETATPVPAPDKPIVVTSPADGGATITAVELIVQGFLQVDASSLQVILETAGSRIDETTIRPALASGERPGSTRHAQFLVRFGLPDPRPMGPMVVRVVAFDRDGQRLAVVRRPFRLGPIDRPTLGDDGLLGGIVFLRLSAIVRSGAAPAARCVGGGFGPSRGAPSA
jgi:hypothetical protein